MNTQLVTLESIKTKKQAVQITHTLSNPDKMPCKGYSLPASECKTGSVLRNIAGSVCSNCYACKGCYVFPVVKSALHKRLASISHPLWIEAMTKNIQGSDFFRWHDSGDIQNTKHLIDIFKICENTPDTAHWLPTKENKIIKSVIKAGYKIPANLNIRYSMPMINDTVKKQYSTGINTSVSITDKEHAPVTGVICQAYRTRKNGSQISEAQYNKLDKKQKGADFGYCGNCRACWNKSVSNVCYYMH